MKVLVADPIAKEGIDLLSKHAEVDVRTGLKLEELSAIIGGYEALVVRSETRVTAEIIKAGVRLQVIARAGTGVDNIDVEEATRRGIVVVNAPAGNVTSAAEHTIALMLALARHIPQAHAQLKSGVWHRAEFVGIEVRGKVLGIVGLGNVGSEVAKRAQAFQMRVIAYDLFISPDYARTLGVELVSLERLLMESDFITLHLPLTAETKGFIGAKELALVKPTSRLINCARGGLIDEEALYQAIEQGGIADAAIDVFSEEPAIHSPLLKSSKVILTPHLGASTTEAQVTVAVDAAEQIIAVLQGQSARYAVNAPLLSPEALPVLFPFLKVADILGRLASQLAEGQMSSIEIGYEGEIASYDTSALKAAVLGGLLERISEERVNLVNADIIAAKRGLRVVERKETVCENYSSLLSVKATTSCGTTLIAGAVIRGEMHIVRVNDYWIDLVPRGGYFLFSDHRDRPGLIGSVGMVTGNADINISSMLVSRLKPRGQALMVLGLDEPLDEEQRRQILSIAGVYTAKVVKL
jgi:D-3-phosphoglycerate dehydrogenase